LKYIHVKLRITSFKLNIRTIYGLVCTHH